MERRTFKILFFIKKTRVSRNGEVPVLLRVTVDGLRAETSINLKVNPELWHASTGRVLDTDRKSEELNNTLDTIKLKIMKIYREMEFDGIQINVFCYLSLILDAYTEEIVGWSVGPTLETAYPLAALRMALKRIEGKVDIHLIHHSDRGCQYASSEYIKLLNDMHILISMTDSGDPKDNAQAERINNTMKNELLKGMLFRNIDEVIAAVARAVDFYNNERPHMSIDMMTPATAAFCKGKIKKHWISYREKAICEKTHTSFCLTLQS